MRLPGEVFAAHLSYPRLSKAASRSVAGVMREKLLPG